MTLAELIKKLQSLPQTATVQNSQVFVLSDNRCNIVHGAVYDIAKKELILSDYGSGETAVDWGGNPV